MIEVPSSTFMSAAPDWGWYIALYFFFGGLAGGCYFLAALIDLVGHPEDRPLARLGYYIAFPCVVISALLLTLDLGQPLRFWHMLVESNTYRPMFKPWSPMSVGSWALLIFGFFSLLSFIGALVEDNRLDWPAGRSDSPSGSARQTHRGDWRALRLLRCRVYRSASCCHQSADLVGYSFARTFVCCFGSIHFGGPDDSIGA